MDRRQSSSDAFATSFRLGTLKTGVWPTILVCAYCVVYIATTWDRPHRGALAGVVVLALASAAAVALLPMERVIRGVWREPFFLGWSVSLTAMIAVINVLDGGAGSPFAPLFFLPLVYAALSYPLPSMLLVGALNLGAFLLVAALTPAPSVAHVFLFTGGLINATIICSWQSLNHDRHRRVLERASRTDPLTGTLNRRGFEERFEAELARARREGGGFHLVVIDLDGFKGVNDRGGHAAGDDLLCWVADQLRATLRAHDVVGRLGGDEFAGLVSGSDGAAAVERLLAALAERTAASAGLAGFPADGGAPGALHAVADARLYAHKRGRTVAPAQRDRQLSWAAALAAAVDERMNERHAHSQVVAGYAAAIATRLGWSAPDLERLRLAAVLHDVGKVRIPDHVLRKAGALDECEWVQVREHPVVGAEIVARVEGLETIGPWIRHSHEHVDGSGYPDGLRGNAIPEASRILLVADAFDAMTSDRPYRAALSSDEAMAELERQAGTQFDRACVAALRAELREGKPASADAAAVRRQPATT